MEDLCHIIEDSTRKRLKTVIKSGVAFSELEPRSKAAFNVLSITSELLKLQSRWDRSVPWLHSELMRVLLFADKMLVEFVDENKDILQKVIGRLYSLSMDVAEFSCDYVRRNCFKRLGPPMVSTQDRKRINQLTSCLSKVAHYLDCAVNAEILKATGRCKPSSGIELVVADIDLRQTFGVLEVEPNAHLYRTLPPPTGPVQARTDPPHASRPQAISSRSWKHRWDLL
ncbi:hypothetical protein FRB91_009345 [Serendipita sp. 411]|nr:hypothetical protein FRB91_009345 [Serendipita sp. 411]